MTEITMMHFVNGEDILCEVLSSAGNSVTVKNPVYIGFVQGPNGEKTLSIQDLIQYSDQKEVDLNTDHLIFVVGDIDPAILKHYNDFVGNVSLIIPASKIIGA
jgi:hypothetical protein